MTDIELLKKLKNNFKEDNIKRQDDDVVKLAVELAYADMSKRSRGHLPCIKETCVEYLIKKIKDYDYENQKFDNWHKDKCEELKQKMNDSAKKLSFVGTIGRAQKIINMTFKYLLLLDDNEKYKHIKNDLHMALDSYTLSWYNSIPETTPYKSEWSKLDNYDDYIKIQSKIREYIKTAPEYDCSFVDNKGKNLNQKGNIVLPNNVFDSEFIIWEAEKNKKKYREIINEINNRLKNKDKDDWFIGKTFDSFLKQIT